jgi:hypothetical protein
MHCLLTMKCASFPHVLAGYKSERKNIIGSSVPVYSFKLNSMHCRNELGLEIVNYLWSTKMSKI